MLVHKGVFQCHYCRVIFNKAAQLGRHSQIRKQKGRCYLEFREQVIAEAHANREQIIAEAAATDNATRVMEANMMGVEIEVDVVTLQ